MNSIPLSAEGVKERYELYKAKEDQVREELKSLRRALAKAARDRKLAYRAWLAIQPKNP